MNNCLKISLFSSLTIAITCFLMLISCTKAEQEVGYSFTYEDTIIRVDSPSEDMINSLGEPLSYYEAHSCDFAGVSKLYTYKNFELDTYEKNNTDYIYAIILTSDLYGTEEGVFIGDSVEKVISVYGEPQLPDQLTYEKSNMKLHFISDSGNIVSIEYLSLLDE